MDTKPRTFDEFDIDLKNGIDKHGNSVIMMEYTKRNGKRKTVKLLPKFTNQNKEVIKLNENVTTDEEFWTNMYLHAFALAQYYDYLAIKASQSSNFIAF